MFYYYRCAETPADLQDILCVRSAKNYPLSTYFPKISNNFMLFSVSRETMDKKYSGEQFLPGATVSNLIKILTAEYKTGEDLLLAAEFPGKTVRVIHTS